MSSARMGRSAPTKRAAVAIAALVLLWPGPGRADDPARARRLFERAAAARSAGRWEDARALLEESLGASPRFSTAWNLVTVLERMGDIAGAERVLVRTRDGAFGALGAEEVRSVASRLAELSHRIATLLLEAPGGAGAEIRIGDEPAGRLDATGRLQLRVSPGAPTISVTWPDGRTARRTVTIGPAETLAVALARAPASQARPHGRLILSARDPEDAVEIVGVARGAAPLDRQLAPDRYRVRLVGDDDTRTILVREGRTRRVVLSSGTSVWGSPWPWIAIGAAVLAGGAVAVGLALDPGSSDPVPADFSGRI